MSFDLTSGTSNIAHLLKGDSRLKRVALNIRTRKNPEINLSGYALINELGFSMFTFFSSEKFPIDEELTLNLTVAGQPLEYVATMSHMNEQISSGRIMNAVPTESEPFPVRKFYRCFAKITKYPVIKMPIPKPELHLAPEVPVETPAAVAETEMGEELKAA